MKLHTRREIIEIWKDQPDNLLDTYVCPDCRDLLFHEHDKYFCNNSDCGQFLKIIKEEEIV